MAARAQAKGGVSGIHIWLIAFVALWLTATVLLVLLYTDQKDLESTNTRLQADATKNRAELAQAKGTMEELAKTVFAEGSGNSAEDVRQELEKLCAQIRDDELVKDPAGYLTKSYHQALADLYVDFKNTREAAAQAESHREELTARVEQLTALSSRQKEEYSNQVAGLVQNLDALKAEWDAYEADRNAQVDSFDEKLADAEARANVDIQEQRTENKRLSTKFDELQNRYSELKDRLGELQITPQELITARQADGRVLTAKPGENVVYIDLGHDAGMVLGLQFAVYSGSAGIPADGQGKARVEVVNIFDSAAECRVVESHSREPILEGDLIANPVFDRERPLQFIVLGRFDVDRDGFPDADGARQIEMLIENWGGTVANELSAQVDFMVLGPAPGKPIMHGDTPESQARYEVAKKAYDEYNETLATAQSLSIPILPQSVFMHFLGYAG